MSKRFRRLIPRALVATTAVALLAQIGSIVPAGATPSSVVPSNSQITAPMEYFANQWHDPMDFNDAADLDTEPGYMVPTGSAAMADGVLNLAGVGQLFLLRHDPGALPTTTTHDPLTRTLDAGVYTRMSFRMWSNTSASGVIGYRTCDNCPDGYRFYNIVAGWHTYDLDLVGTNDYDTGTRQGTPWGGQIHLLWMGLPPQDFFKVDDVEFYRPTPAITVQLTGGSGSVELWSDTNSNQSDDGDFNSGVGPTANRIGVFNAGSTVSLNAGLFRPDQPVRFYTVQNGVKSAESSAVTMPSTSAPSPQITSPAEGDGSDYATVMRGNNPWDFSAPGDVMLSYNVNISYQNGELYATHQATGLSDPVIVLGLGWQQIDATLYHKFEVTITYDGSWGLADAPGGGMVSRVIWRGSDGVTEMMSLPIVMETGTHTYIIDMRTAPPDAALDPASTGRDGWGTGGSTFVDMLRFDPHEDPGGRSFQIDDIKLLTDDSVSPTFPIHFQDNTWASGTTVNLYADTDRDVTNGMGTLIASNVPVNAGDNTYTWNGAGVGAGAYWIHAVMSRGGVSETASSDGAVDVAMNGAGTPPNVVPLGQPGPSQLQIFFFYLYMMRVKFFCGVARARHIKAVYNTSICRLLLA